MRELLKHMLRIFIVEHIVYKLSIFIMFFLSDIFLPQNRSHSTAHTLVNLPSRYPTLFSTENLLVLSIMLTSPDVNNCDFVSGSHGLMSSSALARAALK